MTTPPLFPALPGLAWPQIKKPTFSTIVAEHVSGREVRAVLYRNPIWEFELSFGALAGDAASYPGLGANSLQAIMNLFLVCQGQFGMFLYVDPSDNYAAGQLLGTGDGVSRDFTFARQIVAGGFLEPVGWVTSVSAVFINGVSASGWSLTAPNTLVFSTPPTSGYPISATFAYAFQCRFDDDSADFEQFMQNLWEYKSVKFRSVRSS